MWSYLNWNMGKPEEILAEEFLEEYEENIQAIWEQVVRLNMLIYVLEKMDGFRFDLFVERDAPFWRLVETAFFETAVMTLWRIVIDHSFEKGLTLQQLKNDIMKIENKRFKREEDRQAFQDLLREIDFENTLQTYRPTIREIRHNYIGHFHLDKHVRPSADDVAKRRLLFPELVKLRDAITVFFRALCFGHTKMLLPIPYEETVRHPVDSDSRPDIERILDSLAKESAILNLPERNPTHWTYYREQMSEEDLKVVNRYRRKFGMLEV